MDIVLRDADSGRETTVELDIDDTFSTLLSKTTLLGYNPEHADLSICDTPIEGDPTDKVSSMAAIESGSTVTVTASVKSFARDLEEGAADLSEIPLWARSRRECILAALSCGGLVDIPEALWGDREVMTAALPSNPDSFHLAPPHLRDDETFAAAAVRRDPRLYWRLTEATRLLNEPAREAAYRGLFRQMHPTLRGVRDVLLAAMESDSSAYALASPELRADPSIFHEGTRAFGAGLLRHAAHSLRDDEDCVLASASANPEELIHASARLRNDIPFLRNLVEKQGAALHFALEAPRGDRDTVLSAIAQCGDSRGFPPILSSASETLCGDRDVVLSAVSHRGDSLRHASTALRGDREVVLAALASEGRASPAQRGTGGLPPLRVFSTPRCSLFDPSCIRHASEELRDDVEIALSALRLSCLDSFPYLGEQVRGVSKVARAAALRGDLSGGPEKHPLLSDKPFVLKVVGVNTHTLLHAAEAMRQDPNVIASVPHTGEGHVLAPRIKRGVLSWELGEVDLATVFSGATPERRGVKEVVWDREENPWRTTYRYASEGVRGDRDMAREILRYHPEMLRCVTPPLCDDEEVVLSAVGIPDDVSSQIQEGCVGSVAASRAPLILTASHRLRGCPAFMLRAVQANHWCLRYADPAIRSNKDIALAALSSSASALHRTSPTDPNASCDILSSLEPPLLSDRDVVLSAVSHRGDSLRHASTSLRGDREVVLSAVRAGGAVPLRYAGSAVLCNREAMLEAVEVDTKCAAFACGELQEECGELARRLAEEGGEDEYVMFDSVWEAVEALEGDVHVFMHLPDAMRYDIEVARALLQHGRDGARYFPWLGDSLRNNPEVAMEAVLAFPSYYAYAGEDVRGCRDFILCISASPSAVMPPSCYALNGLDSDPEIDWEK